MIPVAQMNPGECWLWAGSTGRGYALVQHDGKLRPVHRLLYELLRGPIPEGLQLDHLCRVRNCVNPYHLEPVTGRENLMRSPIAPAAINAAKTECPQGHPYDHVKADGRRWCRRCAAAATRRYQARKKEKVRGN